ncbi:hypothetical protein BJX61DRAFT_174688 [Aspergillus egyptiacus]|nr:hypothetical protein BJX61DRAFT_174688 [Aspergillus egyptiacus]
MTIIYSILSYMGSCIKYHVVLVLLYSGRNITEYVIQVTLSILTLARQNYQHATRSFEQICFICVGPPVLRHEKRQIWLAQQTSRHLKPLMIHLTGISTRISSDYQTRMNRRIGQRNEAQRFRCLDLASVSPLAKLSMRCREVFELHKPS